MTTLQRLSRSACSRPRALLAFALLSGAIAVASCDGSGSELGYSYRLGSDTFDAVDPRVTYAVGLGILTLKRGEADLVEAHYTRNSGLRCSVKLVHLVGAQQIIGGGDVTQMLEPGNAPVDLPGFHLRLKESDTWELVALVQLRQGDDALVDGGVLTYRDGSGRHRIPLAGPIRLRRGTGPL